MTDYGERMLFFRAAADFLAKELSGTVSEQDIDNFVLSLNPSPNYPINVLLEDFVECVSLNTLNRIHLLLERHPLVMDHAEATKMGVLKIFNLFSRRQSEGVGAENMATFMLLVSGAVSISDRSGVNLRGEKNESHLMVFGEEYSPLIKSICALQDMLYSQSATTAQPVGAVSKLIGDMCLLIAPSLVESDDLLTDDNRLAASPYFQLDSRAVTVDVNTAVVILTQCLMLIDTVDDKDVKAMSKQVTGLLKKTTVGRRVAKLYPFVSESNRRWKRWKVEEQCKDVYKPPVSLHIDTNYFNSIVQSPIKLETMDHVMTDNPLHDENEQREDATVELSEWALSRQKAFNAVVETK